MALKENTSFRLSQQVNISGIAKALKDDMSFLLWRQVNISGITKALKDDMSFLLSQHRQVDSDDWSGRAGWSESPLYAHAVL